MTMTLEQYAAAYPPEKDSCAGGLIDLFKSLRNVIAEASGRSVVTNVIADNRSKEAALPIVEYVMPDVGVVITVYAGLKDVKVSVKSPEAICDVGFGLMFDRKEAEFKSYEGFPQDRIYGSFAQDQKQFSVSIQQSDLPAFVRAVAVQFKQHTRDGLKSKRGIREDLNSPATIER